MAAPFKVGDLVKLVDGTGAPLRVAEVRPHSNRSPHATPWLIRCEGWHGWLGAGAFVPFDLTQLSEQHPAVRAQIEAQAGPIHRTPEEGHSCPGGYGV